MDARCQEYLLSVMVVLSIEAQEVTCVCRLLKQKTNERASYHPRKYFFTLNRAYQGLMYVTPYFVGSTEYLLVFAFQPAKTEEEANAVDADVEKGRLSPP